MLKSVIRFRKTGTKSHIYNADVELQFIKTLIRLSYDLEYPAMSKHRYEVLSKKNDRIRMYHWRNNRSRKEWKLGIMLALPILFF